MNDVTQVLDAIARGDACAADRLLPLVYDELRRLAGQKMAGEKAGQTLQATALVHEAYLRLLGDGQPQPWNGRGHFFAAAAEAMRRILVDRARRKRRPKHGGDRQRIELDEALPGAAPREDLLALDEALTRLAALEPVKAELVKLPGGGRRLPRHFTSHGQALLGRRPRLAVRRLVRSRRKRREIIFSIP